MDSMVAVLRSYCVEQTRDQVILEPAALAGSRWSQHVLIVHESPWKRITPGGRWLTASQASCDVRDQSSSVSHAGLHSIEFIIAKNMRLPEGACRCISQDKVIEVQSTCPQRLVCKRRPCYGYSEPRPASCGCYRGDPHDCHCSVVSRVLHIQGSTI